MFTTQEHFLKIKKQSPNFDFRADIFSTACAFGLRRIFDSVVVGRCCFFINRFHRTVHFGVINRADVVAFKIPTPKKHKQKYLKKILKSNFTPNILLIRRPIIEPVERFDFSVR